MRLAWPISASCRSLPMRGASASTWRPSHVCCRPRLQPRRCRPLPMPHRSARAMPSKEQLPTMDAVYTKPGYLFRRMQQIAVAIFVEECRDFDVTPVQYAALVAIQNHPGIDATRLSAVIAFDRSTLGSVIERLEAKGYIEREPASDDKRVKLLYLTRSGAKLLQDIMPA